MSPSLDKIISNPELAKSVSIEWIQTELQKQPYNRFLQGLLEERTLSSSSYSFSNHENLLQSIISDDSQHSKNSYFIRDVILTTDPTFAEAENSKTKEAMVTSAAIGAGAIITGSIVTGAREAAEAEHDGLIDPMSNSDQIEESGLLGFLNRLDGSIPKKKANPAVDPMLKEENYGKEKSVPKVLDLTDDNLEETETEELPEQIPTLEDKNESEDEDADGYPDQLIYTDNIPEKKNKKKKLTKAMPQYRWSSETKADYNMTSLDPFTVWINTIDGVEIAGPQPEPKKKKKKKKKKKQFKSLESKPEIASEALAALLINQEHYKEAIAMYEQLSLKNPEKSSFFAAKIETIKDKL